MPWREKSHWSRIHPFSLPQELHVVEAQGCYFFTFVKSPTPVTDQFVDNTGWECFHNKIHVDDYLPPQDSPIDIFHAGIDMMVAIATEFEKYPGRPFELFCTFDGEDCTLNFHLVREGEEYLTPDLNAYESEAIVVLRID